MRFSSRTLCADRCRFWWQRQLDKEQGPEKKLREQFSSSSSQSDLEPGNYPLAPALAALAAFVPVAVPGAVALVAEERVGAAALQPFCNLRPAALTRGAE